MKSYLARSLYLLGCISLVLISLSGCEVLGLAEGVEGIGAADIGAAESVLGSENAGLLERSLARNASGELSITNTSSLNTFLERVRIEKIAGESPRLYIEGKSRPIAEIYAKSARLRLFGTNRFFSIPDNIFSVQEGTINVRLGELESPFHEMVVTTVKQGELFVELAERDGWYKIKLVQNSRVYYGWIEAIYAAPIVLASNKKKNFRIPDQTKMEEDLVGNQLGDWLIKDTEIIQGIGIVKYQLEGDNLIMTVDVTLTDYPKGVSYTTEATLYYNKGEYGWQFSQVKNDHYAESTMFILGGPSGKPVASSPRYMSSYHDRPTRIAFYDDFSENKNTWAIQSTSEINFFIKDNSYILEDYASKLFFSSIKLTNIGPTTDYIISAKMSHLSGIANNGYGILFGYTSPSNYCVFMLSASGYYTVIHINGEKQMVLIPWTATDAIRKGDNLPNNITVINQGNFCFFKINSKLVNRCPIFGNPNSQYCGVCIEDRQSIAVQEIQVLQFVK